MVSRLPQALQRIAAIRAALGSMEGQVPLGGERPAAVGRFADVLAGAMQASASGPQARAARCPADVSAMVEAAARRFGLSADLIHAVIRAESDYDPGCTSPAGAMGLMQLMPGTARALGVHDPYDPLQNIMGGSRYLREQLDRFGSLALALAAYNAGPGAVSRYHGLPPYAETQAYVRRVLGYLGQPREAQ